MLQQNRQITRNSSMMQIRPTGSCCRISAQAWSRSPLSCVSKSMSESIRNGSSPSPVEAAGRASREPLTGNSLSRAPSSGIPALGKAQRRRGLVVINSGAAGGMAHGSGGRGAKVGLAHHVLITLSWVTSDQHSHLLHQLQDGRGAADLSANFYTPELVHQLMLCCTSSQTQRVFHSLSTHFLRAGFEKCANKWTSTHFDTTSERIRCKRLFLAWCQASDVRNAVTASDPLAVS